MESPIIDILMATYNGEKYIVEQIASLQLQTYENWRLLVSDDCSDDNTLQIVKLLADEDPRIKLVSEGVRYGGAKENFMWLMGQAKAPYVMFCDQDDVWLPNKIERMMREIHELEAIHGADSALLALSDMAVVDENLAVVADSFTSYAHLAPNRNSFAQVLAQAIGAGCTFFMNRSLLELACECVRPDDMIMHDWWITAVAAGMGCISYVAEPLAWYRQHSENTIGAVRFDVRQWIGKLDNMAMSQKALAKQAACLIDTYGTQLGAGNIDCARNCSETCSGKPIRNLFNLWKSKSWKYGLRKLGQCVAVFTLGAYGNYDDKIIDTS